MYKYFEDNIDGDGVLKKKCAGECTVGHLGWVIGHLPYLGSKLQNTLICMKVRGYVYSVTKRKS